MIALVMHGILTTRDGVTWPEAFEAYAARRAPALRVLVDQYDAGPFPRLNWLRVNDRMARAMAARVMTWKADNPKARVVLIGHSNGCDIVRRVALLLAEAGHVVDAAVLIAPPIAADLRANGLGELLATGKLLRAVCYATTGDKVLAAPVRWWNPLTWIGAAARYPYGNAGRVGWTDCPAVTADALPPNAAAFTRWFPGFHHTSYFEPAHVAATFNLILSDVHLAQKPFQQGPQAAAGCGCGAA